jgi:hypothetical protein
MNVYEDGSLSVIDSYRSAAAQNFWAGPFGRLLWGPAVAGPNLGPFRFDDLGMFGGRVLGPQLPRRPGAAAWARRGSCTAVSGVACCPASGRRAG